MISVRILSLGLGLSLLPSCIGNQPDVKAIVANPTPTVSPSPTPTVSPSPTPPPVDTMKTGTSKPNEIDVPVTVDRSGRINFDFTQPQTLKVLGHIKPEDLTKYCAKESNLGKPDVKSAEIIGNRVSCAVGMVFYGDSEAAVIDWGLKSVKKARMDGNFGIPVAPDKANKGWQLYFVGKPFTRHLDGLCNSIFTGKNRIIGLPDRTCRQVTPQ